MGDYLIYTIGFLAQALFGSRMLIQWIQSEKARQVVAPVLFWKTSLFASALFLIYGLLRHDHVIVFGQLLSYFIYIRNLQLNGEWKKLLIVSRWIFLALPVTILAGFWSVKVSGVEVIFGSSPFNQPIFIVGGIGQLCLNLRFVYQWYVAESTGHTGLPPGFWMISLFGSALVIAYAVFRIDPVLMLSQLFGMVIYTRNLILYHRSHRNLHAS